MILKMKYNWLENLEVGHVIDYKSKGNPGFHLLIVIKMKTTSRILEICKSWNRFSFSARHSSRGLGIYR